jgi:crossover junction endodeoxyribonuclease RusA
MTAFFIPGVPAPQGSKSFKGFRGGKPILAESSAKVKPWRTAVSFLAHAEVEARGEAWNEPLFVTLAFWLPRPASVTERRRPYPAVKPDLDKLIRSTLDGLTDSGLIGDDAQVVTLLAGKKYADAGRYPGCDVIIEALSSPARGAA